MTLSRGSWFLVVGVLGLWLGCSGKTQRPKTMPAEEAGADGGQPTIAGSAHGGTAASGSAGDSGASDSGGDSGEEVTPLPDCTNGLRSEQETDIDCGGPDCDKCPVDASCARHDDCDSAVCRASTCRAPACDDDVTNGSETDVDCGGGTCAVCEHGKACTVDADCRNTVCEDEVCKPRSCDDAIKNGDEVDVDCGGSECDPCSDGQACTIPADCTSKKCSQQLCISCSDSKKNGNEVDVDCGGSCEGCGFGTLCTEGSHCLSGECYPPYDTDVDPYCTAPHCTNGEQDGDEADVDCGPSCAACSYGRTCMKPEDCASFLSCIGGICALPCSAELPCGEPWTCEDGRCVECHELSDCDYLYCHGDTNVCMGGYCQCIPP